MTGPGFPPTLALLHTAASNIALFDAEADGVRLVHEVRPDLLAAAEAGGGLTAAIAAAAADTLVALSARADAVVLTCSTLGPAVVEAGRRSPVPVIRADAALARSAVSGGGHVVALYAAPTTVEATRALFAHAAAGTGARVDTRIVPGAWAMFQAGRIEDYVRAVARAAGEALDAGADRVALAQASMAPAAVHLPGRPVLTSPARALAEAAARARR